MFYRTLAVAALLAVAAGDDADARAAHAEPLGQPQRRRRLPRAAHRQVPHAHHRLTVQLAHQSCGLLPRRPVPRSFGGRVAHERVRRLLVDERVVPRRE